jgi:hypothetical protein
MRGEYFLGEQLRMQVFLAGCRSWETVRADMPGQVFQAGWQGC